VTFLERQFVFIPETAVSTTRSVCTERGGRLAKADSLLVQRLIGVQAAALNLRFIVDGERVAASRSSGHYWIKSGMLSTPLL